MSKRWKKVASLLLAAVMTLGPTAPVFADISVQDRAREGERAAVIRENPQEHGQGNGLEYLDPADLGISRRDEVSSAGKTAVTAAASPYSPDSIVRVSIVLDQPATIDKGYDTAEIADNAGAMNYRGSLKAHQAAVTAAIEKAIGKELDVRWNLTLTVNVISANVRWGDIPAIEKVEGVRTVEIENRYDPMRDDTNTAVTSGPMTGASEVWMSGYTGAGTRIAVIDTGTSQDHMSFDPEALEYAYEQNAELAGMSVEAYRESLNLLDEEEIADKLDQLNANNTDAKHMLTVPEDLHKNDKIAFAYNYIDGNTVTDHIFDTAGEHGSHVSGIAAANRFVKQDGEFVDAAVTVGAVGMAPDAQIITMKVFGAGGGAYDSDYMAAIEDAIILGADSINLSLGSAAPGSSFSSSYQAVLDGLVASGSVLSVSAGNSGAWNDSLEYHDLYADDVSLHTGGSPGTFINSFSVASADNIGAYSTPLIYNGNQSVFYSETGGYGNLPISATPGTYDYVYVDALGSEEDFAAVEDMLDGRIAMCNRGGSSFSVKAENAVKNGAVATVIVNNQPGVINMALNGYGDTRPIVAIPQAAGAAIKAASRVQTVGGLTVYIGRVEVTTAPVSAGTTPREDAVISSFSSWGGPASLLMKPEITAPGGSIRSVNGPAFDGSFDRPTGGNDQYESLSGTSMAAPHIAGLSALAAQYIRENDLLAKAQAASGNAALTRRNLILSLLMSTAAPMKNDGLYVPVLRAGAGLADVSALTAARTFILMKDGATLSSDSIADGKVMVELGQDAAREGKYEYAFTVSNFSDEIATYELSTDMFTQATYVDEGTEYLAFTTVDLPSSVAYEWDRITADVDRDGDIDFDDAQAILDRVTGLLTDEDINADAADVDKDGSVTSFDAQLLLAYVDKYGPMKEDALIVPAGGSVEVRVTIELTDTSALDRKGGAFIEGYTYLTGTRVSSEGALEDVEHSIPILGYFGSYTDAAMYDHGSRIDVDYDTGFASYFGSSDTDNVYYRLNGRNYVVSGNPYVVENEYPEERAAISGKAVVTEVKGTLIRDAVSSFGIVMKEDGSVLLKKNAPLLPRAYYHVNQGVWMNTRAGTSSIGADLSALSLTDGDRITVGMLAVPEYYALFLDPAAKSGAVSADDAIALYKAGEIGEGALLGCTLNVDSEKPVIVSAELSDDAGQITVTVKDNMYLAYIALCDAAGKTVYLDAAPNCSGTSGAFAQAAGEEVTCVFDLSAVVDKKGEPVDLGNGAAVFVGDYAGNEEAVFVRLREGPICYTTEICVLTDTLVPGEEYLIVNTAEAGSGAALTAVDLNKPTRADPVQIKLSDDDTPYIETVNTASLFTYEESEGSGFLVSGEYGGLGYNIPRRPIYTWAPSHLDNLDVFSYDAETHRMAEYHGYLVFDAAQNAFIYSYTPGEIFIYAKTQLSTEIDPDNAGGITVDPEEVTLFTAEGMDTAQILAEISPVVLADKTILWSSADESVATVDQTGLITAVGSGETTVTASSKVTPSVTADVRVTVIANHPIDHYLYGQAAFDGEPRWIRIQGSDMTCEVVADGTRELYGGGRSGRYIFGVDTDEWYDRFDTKARFKADALVEMDMKSAPLDAASIPASSFTATVKTGENEDGSPITADVEITVDPDVICAGASGYLQVMTGSGLLRFNLNKLGLIEAIAFVNFKTDKETGITSYYYYAMAGDGTLYLLMITPYSDGTIPEEGGGGYNLKLQYRKLGVIEGDGFTLSEDPFAYSMVYLGYNGSEIEEDLGEEAIVLADSTDSTLWFVSTDSDSEDFLKARLVGAVEGASSLVSLFNDDLDAFDTLDAPGGDEENRLPSRMGSASASDAVKNIVLGADVITAVEANDLCTAKSGDPAVNASVGGLSAVSFKAEEAAGSRNTGRSPKTEVSLMEDKNAKNGCAIVTYDPEALAYLETSGKIAYFSVNDTEDGTVKFAYASVEEIEAGETLAAVLFNAGCEDVSAEIETVERNNELGLSEKNTATVSGIGHKWSEPQWSWSADNTSATAYFVCLNDASHNKSVRAVVAITKTDEKTMHTATVTGPDGETYSDTKTVPKQTGPEKPQQPEKPEAPSKPIDPRLPIVIPPIKDNRPTREPVLPGSIVGQTPETPAVPAVINDLPFTDVSLSDSFCDDVKFVFENGIMNGISATEFAPNSTLTRAMVVTILYRVEGEPEVEFKGTFTDVEAGTWYSEAVEWAAAQGIVKGYGNGKFGPTAAVTLEQLAAILNRYAVFKSCPITAGTEVTGEVSDWAAANVGWAVENAVLAPAGDYTAAALRSEVAAAIHAFCVNVAK